MATSDPQNRGDPAPAHTPAQAPPTPPSQPNAAAPSLVGQNLSEQAPKATEPPFARPLNAGLPADSAPLESDTLSLKLDQTVEPQETAPPSLPVPDKPVPEKSNRRTHWDTSGAVQGVPALSSSEPQQVEDADSGVTVRAIFQSAPPWLISSIIHMLIVIILGLWVLSNDDSPAVSLDVSYDEDLGVQLEDKTLDIGLEDEESKDEPVLTPDDLIPTPDPFSAPPVTPVKTRADNLTSDLPVHTPGLALRGREKGMKQALLAAYGGDQTTELAVMRGLRWLSRYQRKDGSWSLVGPYPDGGSSENRPAATAMALIAFQGAGYTHHSGKTTPFTEVVQKGSEWLLSQQAASGDFFRSGSSHHRLYTHALCTIALCELYGMTGDKALAEPAQRAVDYCVKTQSDQGGWRYNPGSGSDTSVTGWFVIALQSAKMAGLEVPYETLERIREYLDTVATRDGSRYKYLPGRGAATLAMTAEGLLCRQYLGWPRNDKRLVDGVDYLVVNLPTWEERDVYYWYYAAQVCHHMEGEHWRKWNAVMKQLLPAKQVLTDKQMGSWDPAGDEWGDKGGGRLYVTCLSIYMLEVYYRHMPIYQHEAFN